MCSLRWHSQTLTLMHPRSKRIKPQRYFSSSFTLACFYSIVVSTAECALVQLGSIRLLLCCLGIIVLWRGKSARKLRICSNSNSCMSDSDIWAEIAKRQWINGITPAQMIRYLAMLPGVEIKPALTRFNPSPRFASFSMCTFPSSSSAPSWGRTSVLHYAVVGTERQ